MGKQRAKAAGQKQLRVIAKHEELTSDSVAADQVNVQQGSNTLSYELVDFSSSRPSNAPLVLKNYSLTVPVWSLSDPFCLHEPCLQPAAGNSSAQDRQLSRLPPLAQNGSKQDALLQPARQPGSNMADIVQLWRERRYRERTQLAYELAHGQQADTLLAEAAWAVMDLLPTTDNGWMQRIKVAAAAAQWASAQLAQQGLLLPVDGVLDEQGAVLPAQGMWLRSMLLLARTLHAAEVTSAIKAGHYSASVPGDVVWLLSRLLPEDVLGARFMIMHMLSSRREWDQLLALCNTSLGTGLPLDMLTLAVAYNKALAAFHVLGAEHPDSLVAVAAALELDKCRWVPLLLGAGALASFDLGPLLVLGSKQEATAYCHNHGVAWLVDSPWFQDKEENGGGYEDGSPMVLGPSLCWLLEKAGLQQLQQPLDKDRVSMTLLNSYSCSAAWRGVAAEVVEQMNVSYGAGTARVIPPEVRPCLLRCELVLLGSLAAATANLPPVAAGPGVWVGVAEMMNADISCVKERLMDCAKVVYDMARQLLQTCQSQQGSWQGSWPGELAHAAVTLAELQPARVRWFWQAGEIQWAKDAAADLLQAQEELHRRFSSSSSSAAGAGSILQPPPVLFSLQGVQAMQEFLNQQTLEACRSSSSSSKGGNKSNRTSGGSSSSSRSRLSMVAGSSFGGSISSGGVRGSSRAVISFSPYEAVSKADEFCRLFFDAAGGLSSIEQVLQGGSSGDLTMDALRDLQLPTAAAAGRQQPQKWLQLLLNVSDKACACCGCINLGLEGGEQQQHHHQQHKQQTSQQQQQQQQHAGSQLSSSQTPAAAAPAATAANTSAAASSSAAAGRPAAVADVAAAAAAAAATTSLEGNSSTLPVRRNVMVQLSAALAVDARPTAHIASLLLAVHQRMQDVYSVVIACANAAAPVPQVSYGGSSCTGISTSIRAAAADDARTPRHSVEVDLELLLQLATGHVASLATLLELQPQVTQEPAVEPLKRARELAECCWSEVEQQTLAALPAHCAELAENTSSNSSSGSSMCIVVRASKLQAAADAAVAGVCDALKQLAKGAADELRGLQIQTYNVCLLQRSIMLHLEQQLLLQQEQQRQQQPKLLAKLQLEQQSQQKLEQDVQQKLQPQEQLQQVSQRNICCSKQHLQVLGLVLQQQHKENMQIVTAAAAAAAAAGEVGSSSSSLQQQHAGLQQAEECQGCSDAGADSDDLTVMHELDCTCGTCSSVRQCNLHKQQQDALSAPRVQQRLQDVWRSTAPAAAAAACAKLKHAAVMAGGVAAAEATAAITWEGLLEQLAASCIAHSLAEAVEPAVRSHGLPDELAPTADTRVGRWGGIYAQAKRLHACLDQAEKKLWGATVVGPAAAAGASALADAFAAAAAAAGGGTGSSSSRGTIAGAAAAATAGGKKRRVLSARTSAAAAAGSSSSAPAAAAASWQPVAVSWAPGQQAEDNSTSSNAGVFVFGGLECNAQQQQQQQQQQQDAAMSEESAQRSSTNIERHRQQPEEPTAASRFGSVHDALVAAVDAATSQLQLLGTQDVPGSSSVSDGSGRFAASSGCSADAGAGQGAAATPAVLGEVQHAAAVDVGQAAAVAGPSAESSSASPTSAAAAAAAAASHIAGSSSSSGASGVADASQQAAATPAGSTKVQHSAAVDAAQEAAPAAAAPEISSNAVPASTAAVAAAAAIQTAGSSSNSTDGSSSSSSRGSADAEAGQQAAAAPAPAATGLVQHDAAVHVAAGQETGAAAAASRGAAAVVAGQAAASAASCSGAAVNPAAAVMAAGGNSGCSSSGSSRGKLCSGCGQTFVKLRRCAGCAGAGVFTGYCSEECQKEAWPVHKADCRGRSKQRQ